MNLEDLTKTQMILLTLLVCFVTSIATGIITVSLLEQAPPIVTQTVSRVIQNTIEKVSSDEPGKTIQTIVVKEEDLVVDAIDQNAKALVAIKINNNGNQGALLGTGFFVSKEGLVMTDSKLLFAEEKFFILSGGAAYPAEIALADPRGFTILRITDTKDATGNPRTFAPVVFGDSSKLKVGQTVIAPSSLDGDSLNVAKGIIARVNEDGAGIDSAQMITLTMSLGRANSGSPLLNTDGEVVGLVVANENAVAVIPSNLLKPAALEQ